MSQSTARKARRAQSNGKPDAKPQVPETHALTFSTDEVVLLYEVVRNGAFPSATAKVVAAQIQQKLEALQPQE